MPALHDYGNFSLVLNMQTIILIHISVTLQATSPICLQYASFFMVILHAECGYNQNKVIQVSAHNQ